MGYQEDFINQIAPHVIAWCNYLGYGVPSAIIGQAALESGYGRSYKAKDYNNFFGLKYKEGRCPCSTGTFVDISSEQRPDGSYYTIVTTWFAFPDMHTGVQGYMQFVDIPRYAAIKTTKDPYTYLTILKQGGYATSINYVTNVMNVIYKHNLTIYDQGYPVVDSQLVYTNHCLWSPNFLTRNKKFDTIVIRSMGNLTDARTQGNLFADPNKKTSSHYGVSSNGEIWQYVHEKDDAINIKGNLKCNGYSGSDYDQRCISIEVENTTLAPWYFISADAMNSVIALCTDICKRNKIPYMVWSNDKNLVGNSNLQNIVLPSWFGDGFEDKFIVQCLPNIVWAVNANLGFTI